MASADDSEDNWKEKLLRNYKSLVHDADLEETLDKLFSEDVFRDEEKELVKNAVPNTSHNKNRQLLKILLQKTEEKYQIFLTSLEEIGHTDIAVQIKNTDINKPLAYKGKNPQVFNLRRKVFQNYDQIIGKTSLFDLLDDFITERIFEFDEFESIENAVPNTTDQRNRQFLDILLKKESKCYDLFLKLLVDQGHGKLITKIKDTVVDNTVDTEIEYHLSDKDDRDPVPKNKREQYQSMIEEWKNEDVLFYETRGTKSVKDAIKKHTVVTVTANMGAGKTATIHHLALELKKDGYDILPVRTPEKIDKYIKKNQKQIFILDDPVGVHSLDRERYFKWVEFDSILKHSLGDGNTKILCSIRKQVINNSDFKKLNCLLNKNIIDIEDEENRLNDDEKLGMIKLHLEFNKVDLKPTQEAQSVFKNMQELFPLSCKIFCSSEDFQGKSWNFFSNPFRLVLDDLEKMQIYDKVKYFVLVLCFAYENSLNSDIFNSLGDKETRHKGEPYMAACGVNNDLLLSSISDNAESLIGVYLKKEGKFYKFIHDLIHDVVAFSVGKKFPEDVIKFSSSKFICDRIIVSDETAPKDDPYVIILPSDSEHLSDLAERLIADLEKGIHNHVLMNKSMNDDKFMKVFIQSLKKKRKNIMYRFFSRKKDITEIVIRSQDTHSNKSALPLDSHERYRDEIEHEIKVIEESGIVNTWSWYYTAMYILSIEDITALHWVVTFGHRILFKYIWENLSTYQKKQVIKKVPLLHFACLGGDIEICKVLLEVEGNKINTYTAGLAGLPLHYAAHKSADVVQFLIDHGADVNAKTSDSRGRTAIYYAAGNGVVDIVNVLIHHGADVNFCHNKGWSPLMIAAQNNHVSVAKLLLEYKADVNLLENDGWSPLKIAAQKDHVNVAKLLLEYKADVNLCENEGWSPLMITAQNNHVNVAKLLLEHKADVNLCSNKGGSPLMITAQNNHVNVAKLLLEHKADVNLLDNKGRSPLMKAAQKDHLNVAKLLLEYKADVNLCSKKGWSPLMNAAQGNHVNVAKLLLEHKADVNLWDNNGRSPLMKAAQKDHVNVAKLLLEYKADVNLCSNKSWSPLMIAAQNNYVNVAKLLLEHKADVNLCSNKGRSPLMKAAENNHVSVAKLLLEYKADVNLRENDGWSPLIYAAQNNHVNVAKLLLEHKADVNLSENDGWSPLMSAAQKDHVNVAKLLLEYKADVNLCSNEGWSPLMKAAENNRVNVAKLLLEHKADVNLCENDGWSPLMITAHYNHVNVAKLLLEHKGNVNLCSNEGWSPLMIAAQKDHLNVAKLLLEHKADVNLCSNEGWSPLMKAAENNHVNVAKLLLEHKADVNLRENDGWSPLKIAAQNNHVNVAKLLLEHKANVNLCDNEGWSPLMIATQNNHVNLAKLLLEHKANVNLRHNEGWSPLMITAQNNHVNVAKLLLEHKADVNLCENDGWSPLMITAHYNHVNVAKLLLEHKADVNLCSSEGWSPLMSAAQDNHVNVAKLLLEYKADVNLRENDGWSPLMIAAQNNHVNVAKLLLKYSASVDLCDDDGKSALMLASDRMHAENDYDVTLCNNRGETALMIAQRNNSTEVISLLQSYKPPTG